MCRLYQERVKNNLCTRCGCIKNEFEFRRKCEICRVNELQYRKQTRTTVRSQQEHNYHVKNWAKRIMTHSIRSDLQKGRPVNNQLYVTECQLKKLRKYQRNRCYYCKILMQVENRRLPDGLTSERIHPGNNPHNCDNVVLCCHRCNVRRVGNKINTNKGLSVYYKIWKQYQKKH